MVAAITRWALIRILSRRFFQKRLPCSQRAGPLHGVRLGNKTRLAISLPKLGLDCATTGNRSNNPKLTTTSELTNAVPRKVRNHLVFIGKQLNRVLFLKD